MSSASSFDQFLQILFESSLGAKASIEENPHLLNLKNSNGETPFHYLVIEKEIGLAGVLLGWGADINTQSDFGDTPLSHSVLIKNREVVEWLICNGALVGITDVNGETALSKSCSNDRAGIFELLWPKINKERINEYFDDFEASRVHNDRELVMRTTLLDNGLRNPQKYIFE